MPKAVRKRKNLYVTSHPWEGRTVWDAVEASVPTGPGQRHHAIFDLVRRIKAIPVEAGKPVEAMRGPFSAWFVKSLPAIRTKSEAESLGRLR